MADWNWDLTVSIADTVTALCAVAGVILAAALGLKAIRIAKGESDRGEQEFLYSQVDSVLQGALSLTSAAMDVGSSGADSPEANQRLSQRSEAFESRMRVLQELQLVGEDSRASATVNQFASVLTNVAQSSHQLRRDGRNLLHEAVFDGESDGSGVLADLAQRVYGHNSYTDESIGFEVSASDGRGISPAFAHDPRTAIKLREKLAEATWEPHVDESLRLVLPWIRLKLGWLYAQGHDEHGSPVMMMESDWGAYFDHETNEMVFPPHPQPDVAAWLDEWPNRFWASAFYPTEDENGPAQITPEDLTLKLVNDLRTAFIDCVVALVSELRAKANKR